MPTPLNYPESRDPNIPGDGRPLQVGDIVTHQAAVGGYRAEVLTVRPRARHGRQPARQVVSLQPILNPGERDRYRIREAGEEAWEDTQLVLLQRPSVTTPQPPPALPASLDPAVPGDGRPFLRGDILRYRHDDSAGSADCQLLALAADGTMDLGKYGARSGHMAGRGFAQRDFALVHRPTAAERHMLPSARIGDGIDGAYVSQEFVKSVMDWLDLVREGKVLLRDTYEGYSPSNTEKLTFTDAFYIVQVFCSSCDATHTPDAYVRELLANSYLVQQDNTRVANTEQLRQGLTAVLNHFDRSVVRCLPCASVGVERVKNSPECDHFHCDVCQLRRTGARCATCEQLYVSELSYNSAETHICEGCCSHTKCEEEGYEEVMLKQHQCQTCKRGPRYCKCPGCEVKGCKVKQVKACCGGCAGHCQCARMCMRHTGMQPLHKFPAPEGETGMTRLLGTEIETRGSAINKYTPMLRKAVKEWKASVITDGSIGGRGVELVTQPAGGSQWRQMIADLGAGFKESESISSQTCGLHMHADCTDVDGFALKRIIQLYAHIEFCLYDAIPLDRQTGGFSKPNGKKLLTWLDNDAAKFDAKMEAGEAKKRLSYIQYNLVKPGQKMPRVGEPWRNSYGEAVAVTTSTIREITSCWDDAVMQHTQSKSDPNRYSGLNMHSYWLRGTLEFRHHHGTNDPVKITNWGFVIGSIVDWCVKHTDEDVPMILGLEPRLAMEMILDGQPDVMAWLKSRWDVFTTAHKVRKPVEPQRDPETGEV